MNRLHRDVLMVAVALGLTAAIIVPLSSNAQNTPKESTPAASSKTEQWIHVRVENKDDKNETVRVNVPIEMAVKVLPAIHKNQLHNGKISIGDAHMDDVDLRALLNAVRSSKDGEYVTVQSHEDNVRVAKNNGYLYVHVTESNSHHKTALKDKEGKELAKTGPESKVEIKVPMKVVDALFSAGKDELDLVAALRALSASGDTELVSVKDADSTVHVWIDSKNISD
jgi:hypothetical protein